MRLLPVTMTMTKQRPVLTGDIPLNPTNEFDAARERAKRAQHQHKVQKLLDNGYEVIRDSTTSAPIRGTYQLTTWLQLTEQPKNVARRGLSVSLEENVSVPKDARSAARRRERERGASAHNEPGLSVEVVDGLAHPRQGPYPAAYLGKPTS